MAPRMTRSRISSRCVATSRAMLSSLPFFSISKSRKPLAMNSLRDCPRYNLFLPDGDCLVLVVDIIGEVRGDFGKDCHYFINAFSVESGSVTHHAASFGNL